MPRDTAGTAFGRTAGFGAVERRLLAAMPVHAVTGCSREDGLPERLLVEAGRLPAAGRDSGLVALPGRHRTTASSTRASNRVWRADDVAGGAGPAVERADLSLLWN